MAVTDPTKLAASGTPGGNLGRLGRAGHVRLGSAGRRRRRRLPHHDRHPGHRRRSGPPSRPRVQQSVTTSVDSLAQSSAGVSFDEETTNLLTYQRAYQASSRVLTTVDETLDTLISHTGRAGL